MSYVDGFVIAVPTANRQKYIERAKRTNSVFIELGAIRVLECWEEEVSVGETTDFRKAVLAKQDESIVFSWIEWPDKATRDAAVTKLTNPFTLDPRIDLEKNPMPFDITRMVFGGFVPVVSLQK